MDTGEGANTIISRAHHYLANHGLGEANLFLHADNCVGQNKNNTVFQVHDDCNYKIIRVQLSNYSLPSFRCSTWCGMSWWVGTPQSAYPYACWTYDVCVRLVFWFAEAEVQMHLHQQPG